MKTSRSILTSIIPATTVILLACLPLLAMVPILANSRESQTLDVQPLETEAVRVPTPPPVIDPPPLAATPAASEVAMALVPQSIPVPMPPTSTTPAAPSLARVQAHEQPSRVEIPIANWQAVVAMALLCVVALIWALLRREPRFHSLPKECAR